MKKKYMGDCLTYFWIYIDGRGRDNKKLELHSYFQFVLIDYLPKGVQCLLAKISEKASCHYANLSFLAWKFEFE
jgi:hypothetical protein